MEYIDSLISAHRQGAEIEHIHLGLFPDGTAHHTLPQAQIAMSERHLHHLAPRDGECIVDLGCGFGGTLAMLDKRLTHAALVGINIDPRQIELARARSWHNTTTWLTCDAVAFSSDRSAWADAILSLEALFHFGDPAAVFANCARALRPAGRLVISTILLPTSPLHRPSVTAVARGFAPWPHPALGLEDLISLAMAAGLTVRTVEDLAPLCLPGFDWMCPPCPEQVTQNPVTELRRLFEAQAVSYPLIAFTKAA